jgi:glycosyltransferase involved in cell wall biosynthesis
MISIIVPVYNTEKFLEGCIESILNQTYTDWEMILIDDGSTDGSGLICDEYAGKDERIRVIHKPNEGVSITRNLGIKCAKGEWITFIDSDDTVEDYYLSSLHDGITDQTDLVICKKNISVRNGRITTQLILKYQILNMGFIMQKLYRRSILLDNNISFPLGFSTMEDKVLFWKYLLNANYLVISPYEGYNYNRRLGTLSKRKHKIMEIQCLTQTITELYKTIVDKYEIKKEDRVKVDVDLFRSCVLRSLISDFTGVPFIKLYHILSNTCALMGDVTKNLFSCMSTCELSASQKLVLYLCKARCYFTLTILAYIKDRTLKSASF